jgi:thiosulfate/3-mercaptopyruvate sulfurtransferase
MPASDPSLLVSTEWLAEHIDAPDICIVDASWHLPSENRNPKAEYEKEHIPGAVFFDIDEISDETSDLPHMLPRPEKFASRVRKLGLGDGNRIVIYDTAGLFSAARVWWMFQVMGHTDVAVLDGGLPKWLAEGRKVSDMPRAPRERHFTARQNNFLLRDLGQIKSITQNKKEQIFDARPAARFEGTAPEPRPDSRAGHMPGAVCLPFGLLLNEDKTFRSKDEIRRVFEEAGYDPARPAVTTCGSGVTAAVVYLGLQLIGHKNLALYDGSWSEWGTRTDTPIET